MGIVAEHRWFASDPARLKWELDRLEFAGFAVDDRAEEAGILIVSTTVRGPDGPTTVRVRFSPEHPQICPKVIGEPGLIPRHQSPGGNFCIVNDEDSWWNPDHAAADLLAELERLLDASGAGPDAVAAGEAPIPEPATGYRAADPGKVYLVPDGMLDERLAADRGSFKHTPLHGDAVILTQLLDEQGRPLAQLDPKVATRLGVTIGNRESKGYWSAIDRTLGAEDFNTPEREAISQLPKNVPRGRRDHKRGRRQTARKSLHGVTYFEEGPRIGERRRAWRMFEVTQRADETVAGAHEYATQALSRGVQRARNRELAGFETAIITVVGAGSIGGHAAIELVRPGPAAIDIIDADTYDLNNGSRHVLTVDVAGQNKAEAVANLAARVNPFVSTHGHALRVGGGIQERAAISDLVAASHTVLDATGSAMATDALYRHCSEAGVPLVSAALTAGGVGGRVVTFRPSGACPECFRLHQAHGTIPIPPEGVVDHFTPYACSHPAASCSGFDVLELVATTVRMTVQATATSMYPPGPDWVILKLRAGADRSHEGRLDPHPDCPMCFGA